MQTTIVFGRRGGRAVVGHAWDQEPGGKVTPICGLAEMAMQRPSPAFIPHDVFQPEGITGCMNCLAKLKERGVDPKRPVAGPGIAAPAKDAEAPRKAPLPQSAADQYGDAGKCATCGLRCVRGKDGAALHLPEGSVVPTAKGRGGCQQARPARDVEQPLPEEVQRALRDLDAAINANSSGHPVDRIRYNSSLEEALRQHAKVKGPLFRYRGIPTVRDDAVAGFAVRRRIPHHAGGAAVHQEGTPAEAIETASAAPEPPKLTVPVPPGDKRAAGIQPGDEVLPRAGLEAAPQEIAGLLYVAQVLLIAPNPAIAHAMAEAASRSIGGACIAVAPAKVQVLPGA